jgi:hypothetical protein
MPILAGIQSRNYRIGQIKAGDKDENGRPRRLEGFRFTTHSPRVAAEVAEFYHGEDPRPWGRQWEVYTSVREIDMALPPGRLVISQAMMRWSGGGPTMVCDGVHTSQPQRGPCQCPQPANPDDEESVWEAIRERRRLAGLKNPKGCYPYTWINVCLVDIGGFGVWQLLSKSENAAAELIQQAELLERARAAGQYLPARIGLEYREARVDGMLRQYNVPVLRVDPSIRAIANGDFANRPLTDQLPPAAGEERRAIAAGRPPAAAPPPPEAVVTAAMTAQEFADQAAEAADRSQVKAIQAQVAGRELGEDAVWVPDAEAPETHIEMTLTEYLRRRWRELGASVPQEASAQ